VVGGGHSSDSSLGCDIGCSRGCLARYRDRGIVWEEVSTKPYGNIDQSHQHWHFNEGADDACERLAGGDTEGADGYRDRQLKVIARCAEGDRRRLSIDDTEHIGGEETN